MRWHIVTALTAALFLAGVARADDKANKEPGPLEGTWTLVSVELNKQPLDMSELKEGRLVVKGEKYSFTLGKTHLEMIHKIDMAKKPHTMDMKVVEGPEKGKSYHAIFKLEGDRLTICRYLEFDKERPATFGTEPDTGLMLIVWKRIDAGAGQSSGLTTCIASANSSRSK